MTKIDEACRAVIERSEWVAITTAGPEGPHLVATWGDYIRELGIRDDLIVIPAGHYNKTEENLRHNPQVDLLFATRQVMGGYGPGQGCLVSGRAEFQAAGEVANAVKTHFSWARAALVVHVEKAALQL